MTSRPSALAIEAALRSMPVRPMPSAMEARVRARIRRGVAAPRGPARTVTATAILLAIIVASMSSIALRYLSDRPASIPVPRALPAVGVGQAGDFCPYHAADPRAGSPLKPAPAAVPRHS